MTATCNRRKSTRYLCSALIISTLIVCGVFVYFSLFRKYYQSESQSLKDFSSRPEKLTEEKCITVCDTEECVHQSKFLLNRVDSTADPCESFFDFACGKYTERFTEHESRNFFIELTSEMRVVLKNLLENIEDDPESASGKVKIVYDTCVKQSSSDPRAIPTLLQYLADFGIPDWPNVQPAFKFVDPSLVNVLGNFLKYQEYGFIDIDAKYIYRQVKFSQVNVTVIIAKSAYEKKKKSTRKFLVQEVLQYFNLDSEAINEIWEESESIHDAVVHLKEESKRIHGENEDSPFIYTADCGLDADIEMKPMCKILETFVNTADVNAGISKRFVEIYGDSVYFMQNIVPLLSNFSDRSIANYLTLNLLFRHLNELNFYFRLKFQTDTDSFNIGTGLQTEIGHWQHCVEWLMENTYMALAHVYMKHALTVPVMEEVGNLIQECIREAADAVSNQEWISEGVRTEMGEEMESIRHSLDTLKPYVANETFVNYLYDQFHPTDASFVYNVFENQRYSRAEEVLGLLQAADLLWVRSTLLKPGAGGGGSSLDIQLGLLFPPVIRIGLQRVINLVSLAATVAHEIGHILNQHTDQFERSDPVAKEHMDKKIQCIENHYFQFKFEYIDEKMNGSRYVRENYADMVAISIIDKFIERYASKGDSMLLPGFPYSLKQMLYISSLQVWCESYTKQDEEHNHLYDTHSLGKFRMIGMMQNSKGFGKAFSCQEDSYMNPSTKCIFPE